jgi:hypothetical protein
MKKNISQRKRPDAFSSSSSSSPSVQKGNNSSASFSDKD